MKKTSYHHGNLPNELLSAAEQELIERGIERFSMRGVAKRANVSHAAPAHHFKDVTGMLTALATLGFQRFCETLARHVVDQAEVLAGEDAVVHIGLGYIEFALANPQLFRLMFSSEYPDFNNAALDRYSMDSFQYLLDAVDLMNENPVEAESGVNVNALSAWSVIHGVSELLLTERLRSVLELPPEQQPTAIKQILQRAISSKT